MWGYSRFEVRRDALTFKHYHADRTLADTLVLPAVAHAAEA